MESKKSPKADVSNRSILFFQLGLIIMLLISWSAIEYKTYDKSDLGRDMLDVSDELEEEDVQRSGIVKFFNSMAGI